MAEAPTYITIGCIGAGHIGSAIAKLAVKHGFKVILSNSRGPETLSSLVVKLGSNASAGTVDDAAGADIVVVTVPLRAYKCVPPDKVVGKVVIDTNNYYPDRDGRFPELESGSVTSSELLQQHLPGAKVVKAFNTIAYFQIGSDVSKRGAHHRRALPIAGDDFVSKKTVADLIDTFGYDVVDVGSLAEGRYIQTIPGGEIAIGYLGSWVSNKLLGHVPVYGVRKTAKELHKALISNGWQPPQGPTASIGDEATQNKDTGGADADA